MLPESAALSEDYSVLGIDTGISVAAIVLTFAEAFCLANRNLLPPLFLLSNIIKLMLFVVLAGLDGAGINRGYDQHRVGGVAAFAIDIIVMFVIQERYVRRLDANETPEL